MSRSNLEKIFPAIIEKDFESFKKIINSAVENKMEKQLKGFIKYLEKNAFQERG